MSKNTLQMAMEKIEELEAHISNLYEIIAADSGSKAAKPSRKMTEEDAFRVKYGDLREVDTQDAADMLGLSYGQVYTCRDGGTKKHVTADWQSKQK